MNILSLIKISEGSKRYCKLGFQHNCDCGGVPVFTVNQALSCGAVLKRRLIAKGYVIKYVECQGGGLRLQVGESNINTDYFY